MSSLRFPSTFITVFNSDSNITPLYTLSLDPVPTSITTKLNYVRHTVTQNFLNQCIICSYLAYLPLEPKPSCPLCLNMVGFMTYPHSLGILRKLNRISEVFHWEEFVCLLNDAIIQRMSDTLGLPPDKESVYLPSHFGRMMWPKTEQQMTWTDQARAWHLAVDIGVVYEKAMLRRGVFGHLGLSIGGYEIIHG